MFVKYNYDKKTQKLLEEWNGYLREFDAMFYESNYANMNVDQYTTALYGNKNRRMITSQIEKIYVMAIPDSIEFVE